MDTKEEAEGEMNWEIDVYIYVHTGIYKVDK